MDEKERFDKMVATIEALPASIEQLGKSSQSALDRVVAEFKEAMPKAKTEDVAEVKEGALAGITKTEVFGIPIGAVAIGTFGGVFVNEILDGFLAAQGTMVKGGAKLAMAGITATWGKRWLGKDVAYAIAFVLGVFGLSQVLPIDKWAAGLAGSVKGILPGTIKVTGMPGSVVTGAERVAENYYARLGGAR